MTKVVERDLEYMTARQFEVKSDGEGTDMVPGLLRRVADFLEESDSYLAVLTYENEFDEESVDIVLNHRVTAYFEENV